jgi:hypothetical protein
MKDETIFHLWMKDETIFHLLMKDETIFHLLMKDEGFRALKRTRPIRKVEKRLACWTLFLSKWVRQDWDFACV